MAWDFIDIPNSFSESAVFQEIGPNPHEFLQPALYLASGIDRNDERRDGQLSPEQDHHAQVQGNQEVDAECAAERFLPKGQTPDPPAAVRRDSLLFLYRILVVGQKGIVYEAEPVVLAILRQIQQAAQEGQLFVLSLHLTIVFHFFFGPQLCEECPGGKGDHAYAKHEPVGGEGSGHDRAGGNQALESPEEILRGLQGADGDLCVGQGHCGVQLR